MLQLAKNISLENLRKQAKTLLKDYRAGFSEAVTRVAKHYADGTGAIDYNVAHLMVAREYGFRSWTRLKAYIEKFGEDLREGHHPVVLTIKDVTVLPEVFPRQDCLCLTSKNPIRFDTEENLAIHLDLLGEAHRVQDGSPA